MPRWIQMMSNWAGMGTWLLVGIPVAQRLIENPQLMGKPTNLLWLGAWLVFGLMFYLVSNKKLNRLSLQAHRWILLGQVVLATVALFSIPDYGFAAVLYIITASHAPHVLRLPWAVGLILLQSGLLVGAILLGQPEGNDLEYVVTIGAYLGFQLFALFSTETALREAAAKTEMAKLNAELKATQALLTESSKVGERVRIARELHDLIGHQLTALSLNLEVASHTEGVKAKEHIFKSQQIAKELLSDVRGVVGTMRESQVNLEAALRALVEAVPKPTIHLSLSAGLNLEDPHKAHALVRCVQEAITNTVRHAQATNLWISVEQTAEGVRVHAHDDGRGARIVEVGNGLTGMRERLEGLGGKLSVQSEPGKGFKLDAVMPI